MRKPFEIALRRSPLPALALAAALTAFSAPAAHAEFFSFFFGGDDAMRGEDVVSMLQDRGLELMGPIHRNGRVYIVDVRTPRGAPQRLILDAYDGHVLQRFRLGPPRYEASLARQPSDLGPGYLEQSAPPVVETYGEQMSRGEDADTPNGYPRSPAEDGIRAKSKNAAKHKKIDLTPTQPASNAPAKSTTPDAAAPAQAAPAPAPKVVEAKPAVAVTAPAAAPAPVAPAPAPAAAPKTPGKPAINDVPVDPLD
jgi:hypothetical protein